MIKTKRILRIWYYGRLRLAKAINRRIQFEMIDWFEEVRKLNLEEIKRSTYTVWDSRTGKTFESDAPMSATIKLTKR